MTRLYGHLSPNARAELLEARGRFAGTVARVARFESAASGDVARHPFHCGGTALARQGSVVVALAGHPAWLDSGAPGCSESGAIVDQICAAYAASGLDFLPRLAGSFALAIVDRDASVAHLAIDRMGMERLCWAARDSGIVFGTSAADVARTPGIEASLRRQALFDYLFMHMIPAPGTVYEGVSKLPPATVLTFRDGNASLRRYWQPEPVARNAGFESLREGLFEGLRSGTRAAGLDERTGAFLSGGLDSSTVAGILAEVADGPARTFTVGFGVPEYDEVQYARISARQFGCEENEYNVVPGDIVDAFPELAAHFDEPFGNSSAVPGLFCARFAKQHGIDHLLAGDGGDELFGGNERYARQKVFGLYGQAPGWLRRGLIDPLAGAISPESLITPLRKLRSYVDQAAIPLPDRFETWNFVYREGRSTLLDPAFADSVNLNGPLDRMREVWEETAGFADNLLDHMLYYDWQFTLADNDLRKVGAMCELAGVRVSYPMLHPDVVDLSLRVPARLKMRGLELRSFYRKAMKGFLADDTLSKNKHGFGLPFGVWLKDHKPLGELVYGYLADLKKRSIVSAPFIDNLIEEHRAGHPSYYGYAIWDLAMLEAWLQAHGSVTGEI